MSQGTVLKFLENHPKGWFTYNELKLKLNLKNCLSRNIIKLYNSGDVDRIEITLNGFPMYLVRYKLKGRTQIYK